MSCKRLGPSATTAEAANGVEEPEVLAGEAIPADASALLTADDVTKRDTNTAATSEVPEGRAPAVERAVSPEARSALRRIREERHNTDSARSITAASTARKFRFLCVWWQSGAGCLNRVDDRRLDRSTDAVDPPLPNLHLLLRVHVTFYTSFSAQSHGCVGKIC